MVHISIKAVSAAIGLSFIVAPGAGRAQQAPNTQWFVPGHHAASPAGRPAPRPVATGAAPGSLPLPPEGGGAQPGGGVPPLQVQLPPAPPIPAVPKGQATPAAIIGILSVPDVLRVSTAYQAAYKELNARGQKLNEDAQKEQGALRELGQKFAAERARLSPEQIRTRERKIQDRATEAQRRFGERNRIIQEAGQYVMMQINRTMEQVAQQVALSRGINLVLNRAQILGTTADFDLTPAVAEVLNKALPSVVVPPDGVSPLAMTPPKATPAKATAAKASPPKETSSKEAGAEAAATKPPTKH